MPFILDSYYVRVVILHSFLYCQVWRKVRSFNSTLSAWNHMQHLGRRKLWAVGTTLHLAIAAAVSSKQ